MTTRSAIFSAVTHRLIRRTLKTRPPGGSHRWQRTNYAGRTVTLLDGAAVAAAAAVAPAAQALGAVRAGSPRGYRPYLAAAIATGAAGPVGLHDDMAEAGVRARGLRGHLGALRQGRATTGFIKILGIGAGASIAAAITGWAATDRRGRGLLRWACDATLIAGSANLVNLLDLRPGRATKTVTLASAAMTLGPVGTPQAAAGRDLAGAALAVCLSSLPDDLREHSMLGDTGANALGALAGSAAVTRYDPPTRMVITAVVVGLILASEKISFTRVIASNPALAWADSLGRRP